MHETHPTGIQGIALGGGALSVAPTARSPRPAPLRMPAVILVVDDDAHVRVMLARLLKTQGYEVVQAAGAREAHTALEAQRPDLVISDIVMPGESGIELRRLIATRWPGLPVILISGYSAEGPAEFAARTANTIFVQKPFAADQLLTLVEETIPLGGSETAPLEP